MLHASKTIYCHKKRNNENTFQLSLCMYQRLATGWTVRGSNPGGGEIFRTCPVWLWDTPSLLYNGYRVSPRGKERPGRDADSSPPSSAIGHERVELYSTYGLYSLYRASVSTRVHFTLCVYRALCKVYYTDQPLHNMFINDKFLYRNLTSFVTFAVRK